MRDSQAVALRNSIDNLVVRTKNLIVFDAIVTECSSEYLKLGEEAFRRYAHQTYQHVVDLCRQSRAAGIPF
jgi:hypothetical protein